MFGGLHDMHQILRQIRVVAVGDLSGILSTRPAKGRPKIFAHSRFASVR